MSYGEKTFTEQQRIALTNPCFEAEDCANPIYKRVVGPWSLILTMNVGFE